MDKREVERPPSGLRKHAEERSAKVVDKIRVAIELIRQDIEHHDGIYPLNKGRLTKNEVCRRAGINAMTLQGDTHKNTTNLVVDEFLRDVKLKLIQGRKSVRRTVTDRAENWKYQHGLIANAYHLAVLEHNQDRVALNEANRRNKELEKELCEANRKLAILGRNVVISFGRKK